MGGTPGAPHRSGDWRAVDHNRVGRKDPASSQTRVLPSIPLVAGAVGAPAYAILVVRAGKDTVSRVLRSRFSEVWSMSIPTALPWASKSTTRPSAIWRGSAPGFELRSI